MRHERRWLFGLIVGLFLAAPAHALTIRVDWWADAVATNYHPRGTIHVQGSFGDFELTAFPALVPIQVPFSARAPGFGPGFTDDVYTFEFQRNLSFEFTGVDPGLRGVGGAGVATASKVVCSPPNGYCEAGEAWSVDLYAPADGGPASLGLSDGALQSGYTYFWSGPLHYAFTVVPEPATIGPFVAGLFALGCRRSQKQN